MGGIGVVGFATAFLNMFSYLPLTGAGSPLLELELVDGRRASLDASCIGIVTERRCNMLGSRSPENLCFTGSMSSFSCSPLVVMASEIFESLLCCLGCAALLLYARLSLPMLPFRAFDSVRIIPSRPFPLIMRHVELDMPVGVLGVGGVGSSFVGD